MCSALSGALPQRMRGSVLEIENAIDFSRGFPLRRPPRLVGDEARSYSEASA